MSISKFSRISTTVCPGSYASVIYISDDGEDAVSVDEVTATLLKDRDSLDMLAVDSEDIDPLDVPTLYKSIKAVKPSGMHCMVVTEGRDPAALDDLMGAGYADMACFRFTGPMTDAQSESVDIVEGYGYQFIVSVSLVPGRIDEDSLKEIAGKTSGCRQFLMRSSDPRFEGKSFKKKELEALARSVKGLTKHPVLM